MLIDELINFCEYEYSAYGDTCGCGECSHPSGRCSGNCSICLDEVHWGPHDGKRTDYNCNKLLYLYVLKFASRYMNNIRILLKCIDLSRYTKLDVFSIGCGAAPDLMAFESQTFGKDIFYTGYDKNKRWKPIHDFIERYTASKKEMVAYCRQQDIFDAFADGEPIHHQYNVVVIQYLISHLYNTRQNNRIEELYCGIINNIISRRLTNTPFLIIINDIDSCYKGRNLFHKFLDVLEEEGYSGSALAYSLYPDGDLGKARWGYNIGNRPGKIEYIYRQPPLSLEGASLIIELR